MPAEKKSKVVEIQTKLYGLEAVHKACYSFLDQCYVRLEGTPEGVIRVILRAKEGVKLSLDAVAGEFENELLHQAIRVKVSDSNRKIREFVVTRALLSAQGVSAPGAAAMPETPQATGSVLDEDLEKEIEKLLAEVEKAGADAGDPLSISVPWDEKNGKAVKSAGALTLEAAEAPAGGGCGSGCGCGSEGHGHESARAEEQKEGADAFEV